MVKKNQSKYEEKKSSIINYSKELDIVIYWATLLVLIISNFLVSIIIMPLLLLTTTPNFYILVGLLGILFGYIFSILINYINDLEPHHHLTAITLIPVLAVVNIAIISSSLTGIASALGIESNKNPFTISLLYSGSFLLPYIISLIRKRI